VSMETLVKQCAYCGSELDKYHVNFCSKNCFNSYHKEKRENKELIYCKNCGKVLTKTKTFCNRKCQHEYQRNISNTHWKGVTERI
jgi:endogenous inhibitor of DNA gyrase (YacG/DUF329 family)